MSNNGLPQYEVYGIEIICNHGRYLFKKVKVLGEIPQSVANTKPDHSDKYGDIRSE
jgi:hypothetical protein